MKKKKVKDKKPVNTGNRTGNPDPKPPKDPPKA